MRMEAPSRQAVHKAVNRVYLHAYGGTDIILLLFI